MAHRPLLGAETGYGIGWFVDEDAQGGKVVRHGGAQTGVRASLVYFVDKGVVVSVLCNSEWSQPPRILVPIARLPISENR